MMRGTIARLRSLARGLGGRRALDAEMDAEFRAHMELRAADLEKDGFAPGEAMRRARLEFGVVERYKEEGRRARGLGWRDAFDVSWLDVVLGWRMLAKYPGITIVGGLAMAFAIWVGAGTFEMATQVIRPSLPLPDGDRIVALRNRDVAKNRIERKSLHDLVAWREQLATVGELGAYRAVGRNLVTTGGEGEPAEVAEMTASGFRVARVPAMLGRTLVAADERPDAPPVVVLGHELWRRRFAADPAVLGKTVRLGRSAHTVVGVMPEGFAFPVNHELWVPLRVSALDHPRRQGPAITMFGRLAAGVTMEEARAELTTVGRRAATEWRDTHEHLRPEIVPYARSVVDISGIGSVWVMSVNVPLLMLLVLVCANVALLMFARAATREGEIVVRNALGATRGRIVAQLFTEALVLGGVAAAVGLAAAGFGLRWVMGIVESEMRDGQRLPFWFQDRLSPTTVLYAIALTVLGAAIAGVLPAFKVTRGIGQRLRAAGAGGGGLQFGGVWTAVIVAQVAVTVAFPMSAYVTRRDQVRIRDTNVNFASEQFLAARVEMDAEPPPGTPDDTSRTAFAARFAASLAELERRLAAAPAVVGVTYGDRLPRMYHPHRLIEVDAGGSAPLHPQWPAYRVSSASVDPRLFDVFGVSPRAGRRFHSGDATADGSAVIVNESFVRLVLGGRNPIGRRLRYVHYEEWSDTRPMEPGAWYEIVGVVPDMGMAVGADVGGPSSASTKPGEVPRGDPKVAGIYHPGAPGVVAADGVSPGGIYPLQLAIRLRGDPAAFAARLRVVATAADPSLRVYDPMPLDTVNRSELEFLAFWIRILLMVSAVALMLSLAGIYAVMAFTVSRRTREIGIRIALGAERWRIVAAVFRRPLRQVLLGILAGGCLIGFIAYGVNGGTPPVRQLVTLAAYAVLMFVVCLLACVVPTRRALAVEPTEALRGDG